MSRTTVQRATLTPLIKKVMPDFYSPIASPALLPVMANSAREKHIALLTFGRFLRIRFYRFVAVVGGRHDRQSLADRLDAERFSMLFNEHDHFFRRRSRSAAAKKAEAFRRISLAWRSSFTSRFSSFSSARSDWLRSYCQIWCLRDLSCGGGFGLGLLDAVFEIDALDDVGEMIEAAKFAPVLFGALPQFEDHVEHAVAGQTAL